MTASNPLAELLIPEQGTYIAPHDLRATVAARRRQGQEARQRIKRSAHAAWGNDGGRDPVGLLRAQDGIRSQRLLPLRYGRMAVSPWNFYRGAAAVMAADLASSPHSGLVTQLCGDAHVLNFGLWATPERNLVFDLRDFDETLPGPFEWDVKRLAASLVVAGRANGVPDKRTAAAVVAAVDAYASRMRIYAEVGELDVWYEATRVESLIGFFEPADRGAVTTYIEKQKKKRTAKGAFKKLAQTVDGRPRITPDPPIRITIGDQEQRSLVEEMLVSYRLTLQEDRRNLFDRFTLVDAVRQVVGVGSVGMRVYLLLFQGRSGDDPLFFQVKQAGPSVYEPYVGPASQPNHGNRVIAGKRLLQSATDIFVGWGSFYGHDYYVRQFRDMKIIPNTEMIAPRLTEFAVACGETLARAHARTGDAVAISAYLGTGDAFAEALVTFARRYADQNDADHARLVAAIEAGRVVAATQA